MRPRAGARILVLLMAMISGACGRLGPLVINEAVAGVPGGRDWVELCYRGTDSRDLEGWSLRLEEDGQERVLHTFGRGETLPSRRYLLVSPEPDADLSATLALPVGGGRAILKIYDGERSLVDALALGAVGEGATSVTARRCNCQSHRDRERDAVVGAVGLASPGAAEHGGGCADPALGWREVTWAVDAGPLEPSCAADGCHPWFPLAAAGRTWGYGLESGGGERTLSVEAHDGGPWELRTRESHAGGNSNLVDQLECTGSVLRQRGTRGTLLRADGTSVTEVVTYTPPAQVLPERLEAGALPPQQVGIHAVLGTPLGTVTRDVAATLRVQVQGPEDLQSGGQTFTAWRVEQSWESSSGTQTATWWVVPGLGPVRQLLTPSTELPGSGAAPLPWEWRGCRFPALPGE